MPFDIGLGELLVISVVALIVIGPKDLPNMFRSVGRFTGRMRAMADDFRRTLESAADDAGVKDLQSDFQEFSDYVNDQSGVREANQAIRDVGSSSASAVKSAGGKSAQAKDDSKAKTEAVKAQAKADALRVQLEQAEREAAGKAELADQPKAKAKKPAKKPSAAQKNASKTAKPKAEKSKN